MKTARFGRFVPLAFGTTVLAGLFYGLWAGISAEAVPKPKVSLTSHRAIYSLSLVEQGNEMGLLDAKGRIAIEVTNLCTGYATNQRLVTEMWPRTAPSVLSEVHLSSYESADGNSFQFSMRDYQNEQPEPAIVGKGLRDAKQVQISEPETGTQTLPEGTIFPSELTVDLVAAARSGARTLTRRVYEGSNELEVFDVAAVIGNRRKAAKDLPKALQDLNGLSYWPVSISYYEYGDVGDVPEYQVVFHLYENGVSTSPVFDYGDFRLRGQIIELDVSDPSECG